MNELNLDDFKGIIFDLDGVIYDITEAIKKAVEDGIEKYQMNVSRDEVMEEIAHLIEDIQNYPVPEIILNSYTLLDIKFLEGLSFFKKLRIGIYLFTQFNQYKDEESKIFEGIAKLISNLSRKNLKLAILTNNKSSYAEEVLSKFNLTKFFDPIIGFNDVSKVKPDPEGILKILEIWKIKPSQAIFVGDMTTDIDAGKAANVRMICVSSGLAKKETLIEHEPDILVNNTEELIKIFNI
ncbi:MAG: HAD-IA family hydrolase [Candidatus Lokiarchaeota archaeon]|nr:HAD-IA family hydrolase [Candidatus Lokiarchaeota archaeon]